MKKIKFILLTITLLSIALLSGCSLIGESEGGMVPVDPLDLGPNEKIEDSAMDDLTPLIIVGTSGVAVYKCTSDTDCNRCENGDVYGQTCIDKTCQGSLDLIENCKEGCSAGECTEKDILTGEETIGTIGEDYEIIEDDSALVNNEDLLQDKTNCPNKIQDCIGFRGIGSMYLDDNCKCKIIYVPASCNPMEPPCPDYSSKSNYPDCACP